MFTICLSLNILVMFITERLRYVFHWTYVYHWTFMLCLPLNVYVMFTTECLRYVYHWTIALCLPLNVYAMFTTECLSYVYHWTFTLCLPLNVYAVQVKMNSFTCALLATVFLAAVKPSVSLTCYSCSGNTTTPAGCTKPFTGANIQTIINVPAVGPPNTACGVCSTQRTTDSACK